MEWQAELLGHLRRVHFGLMGLSFALIIAGTLIPSATLNSAYEQLRAIDVVRTKYLIYSNVSPRAEKEDVHFLSNREMYQPIRVAHVQEKVRDHFLIKLAPQSFARIGSLSWGQTRRTTGAKRIARAFHELTPVDAPDSLEQFAQTWDFLAKSFYARILRLDLANARAFRSGTPVDTQTLLATSSEGREPTLIDATFGILEEVDSKRTFAPRQWFVVVELNTRGGLSLPLDEIHIPIEVKYLGPLGALPLVIPVEDTRVPIGEFKTSFGDLARIAKGLETMRISNLTEYVANRRLEADRQIQLLGVEVPKSVITQWGMALLLSFQAYFLLHLRHACNLPFTTDATSRYPWIGLYVDKPSSLVFLSSVTILPAFAGMALIWSGLQTTTGALGLTLSVVLMGAVIGLATLTVLQHRQLSRMRLGGEDLPLVSGLPQGNPHSKGNGPATGDANTAP
jgi:hypothetical protein